MLSKRTSKTDAQVHFTGGCQCGAIRYAVTDEPITAATCHCRDCQYSSGGAPAHALLFPAGSVTLLRGAARSTATAAVRAAPSCAASARTVARRYSAAPRAPTTTWSAPARWTTGSLPRAGQPVDRLGAVLAPHRCRRAQFSRQCATDSLRPTRYAAAKQKGRVLQDSPFLHATSGLPWRAVHLCMAYCTTCASLPEAYWAAISVSGRALILLALPAVPNSV